MPLLGQTGDERRPQHVTENKRNGANLLRGAQKQTTKAPTVCFGAFVRRRVPCSALGAFARRWRLPDPMPSRVALADTLDPKHLASHE
jgi:hypothetical protein